MRRAFDLWRRAAGPARHAPDAELLDRFARHADGVAFAALVDRHGPLVYGTCRRHLPDPADAEDAFQAVFLVLVRRAADAAGRPVGPWLHRVAVLTAKSLRRRNAGRRAAQPVDAVDAAGPDATAAADARLDVDALLSTLPRKYRVPLVLCHLQGRARREAAEHLGVSESAVASLLTRGLAKLRARVAGRDPAVLLAAAGASVVPARLTASAVRAASLLTPAAVSPAVLDLTNGVVRMMQTKTLAAAGLALAAAAVMGAGAWLGNGPGLGPTATAQQPAAPAEPAKADEKSLDRQIRELQYKLRELERQKKLAELFRQAREQAEDAERVKRLVDKVTGPFAPSLELTVRPGAAANDGAPALELKELVGRDVRLRVSPADRAALKTYLTRAMQDQKGPRRLHVRIDKDMKWTDAKLVIDACTEAGFTPVLEAVPAEPAPPGKPGAAAPERPPYVIEAPDILTVEVVIRDGGQDRGLPRQPVSGQHLVRPDGTIGLGVWGSVPVAGLTIPQAADAVRDHLVKSKAKGLPTRKEELAVVVDVLAYNSKAYYVVTGGPDGEQVHRFPCTGNDTVLDAVAAAGGPKSGNPAVWVARRKRAGDEWETLPVDWKAITQLGDTATNYQILPGDRVYVRPAGAK